MIDNIVSDIAQTAFVNSAQKRGDGLASMDITCI